MRNLVRSAWALLGGAASMLPAAGPARAHAFGQRYDLPLPLELYLVGAGAAVTLSFAIMAVVFRTRPSHDDRQRIDLLEFGPIRGLLHPASVCLLQMISAGLFILVLAAGFLGTQDTLRNIGPTFVWIVWWVGLAYVTALVGNLWPVVNPWSILIGGLERLIGLFGPQARLGMGLAYPSWLGVWPAAGLFGAFAWIELISQSAKAPATLAAFILIYSGITWLGMLAFGRKIWLAHGEAFSLVFGVLGRFAPIGGPDRDASDGRPSHWYLRPYAGDLIVERPCHPSMTAFVVLMLSTVTLDGFMETPLWAGLSGWIAVEPWFHPVLLMLHEYGFDLPAVLGTVMLVLFPVVFFLVYLGFSWLTKLASGSGRPLMEIAGLFVFSLVPIAIAYHLAHYLSYLLVAGQQIIPLVSDPFGFGWDLFGTAGYRIDIGIIGARFVWYAAVVSIVAGHVFAVGVAHFMALRVFDTAKAALRSQYPFLVLMVAYTMVSLWILSQPITGSPSPTLLRAPSGTLSLGPLEFREYCLEMKALDEIQYDFKSDRPVEFNIHYHQGIKIHLPVQLEGVSAHAGEFIAQTDQAICLMWHNRGLARPTLTYRVAGP